MRKNTGFTLIELMIVVAIIAIIAAIAIPGLLRARIASNETSAIGTLRTLATSQAQFQSAAIVDQDADGTGEFGWLQELSGATGYRDAFMAISATPTSPSFITSVLGTTAMQNGGVGGKSGFSFLVYLPTDASPATPEGVGPPTFILPDDANRQEVAFCCYAIPASLGNSGNRCFVINQQGEVFSSANKDNQDYGGTTIMGGTFPPPEAAYVPSGLEDPTNLEGQFVTGTPGQDGYLWLPAGN